MLGFDESIFRKRFFAVYFKQKLSRIRFMRQSAVLHLMIIKRAVKNHLPDAFDCVKTAFGREITAETNAARIIQIGKRRGADFRF